MRTIGRARACLGRHGDSAKVMSKPSILLRTKEGEYSIKFVRNFNRVTPRGSLHSNEYKGEKHLHYMPHSGETGP